MRLENVPTLSSIEFKCITLFSIALTSCNDIEKLNSVNLYEECRTVGSTEFAQWLVGWVDVIRRSSVCLTTEIIPQTHSDHWNIS